MHAHAANVHEVPRQAILALIGSAALAAGALVYLTDRAPIPHALVFGEAGQWLPSFVHPFAFSLFTAAASFRSDARGYAACAGWWAVNVAAECGQHPSLSAPIAAGLHACFGDAWPAARIADYFVRGTFDFGDLAAATLGAMGAAFVLWLLHRGEESHVA